MDSIIDGTGNGYRLEINSDNRAVTSSITETKVIDISERKGLAFIFASGDFIDLTTTATETGFFHLKNTDSNRHLHVKSIRTCGSQLQKWKLYKDVTTGTLISNATAGSKNNMNFSSSKVPLATVVL